MMKASKQISNACHAAERKGGESMSTQKKYEKSWRERHPEKVKGYQKTWRKKNPEKVATYHKRYQDQNPEKVAEWHKRSREKARNKQRNLERLVKEQVNLGNFRIF